MLVVTETIGRTPRAWRASALACSMLAALTFGLAATPASPAPSVVRNATIIAAVDEAAARFDIPTAWIYAVMHQESGGQTSAMSAKGAMGLLQLMPATWRELTTEFGLSEDPFEPRANILAGAAYMRRMYDRFGSPGFLAAYNAGPERYARSLAQGTALPQETRTYVRKLSPLIAQSGGARASVNPPLDWRRSGVFVVRGADDALAADPQAPGAPWVAVRR